MLTLLSGAYLCGIPLVLEESEEFPINNVISPVRCHCCVLRFHYPGRLFGKAEGAKHNKCSITPLFPAVFVILEAMSWCYLVGKKFWHQKRNGFTLWDEVLQLQSWRSLWQQLEPSLMQRKTVGLQQNVVSFTGHLLLQLRWLY